MKTIISLIFFFTVLHHGFSQQTLGKINFHFRNAMVQENNDVKININPFWKDRNVALVEIEKDRNEKKDSIEISIEKYNELKEAILKINPSDFTQNVKFCADGTSIRLGFGGHDRVNYSFTCVSTKSKNYKDLIPVIRIIMEISKVEFDDF